MNNLVEVINFLSVPRIIFWDFDGVIKDSVEVKGDAFVSLFESGGVALQARIKEHHMNYGGMSRFDKLPLYLAWAGIEVDDVVIADYSNRFSSFVRQAVVDSPWVPGVENYLRKNSCDQTFILVSATPQSELESILYDLELFSCFTQIHGAPSSKKEVIKMVLDEMAILPGTTLMVGDAASDMAAANANGVPFLLRRSLHNVGLMPDYHGPYFENLHGI